MNANKFWTEDRIRVFNRPRRVRIPRKLGKDFALLLRDMPAKKIDPFRRETIKIMEKNKVPNNIIAVGISQLLEETDRRCPEVFRKIVLRDGPNTEKRWRKELTRRVMENVSDFSYSIRSCIKKLTLCEYCSRKRSITDLLLLSTRVHKKEEVVYEIFLCKKCAFEVPSASP